MQASRLHYELRAPPAAKATSEVSHSVLFGEQCCFPQRVIHERSRPMHLTEPPMLSESPTGLGLIPQNPLTPPRPEPTPPRPRTVSLWTTIAAPSLRPLIPQIECLISSP